MPKITIGGTDYDSYATVADGDAYWNADINGAAWTGADTDTKGRALVTASRWLAGTCWQSGTAPSYDTPPEPVKTAAVILAGMLVADPELYAKMTGAVITADGGTKRMKAGSVEIEYFRKMDIQFMGGTSSAPFPANVMAIPGLSDLLCPTTSNVDASSVGARSFDTCRPSQFDDWKRFGYYRPL